MPGTRVARAHGWASLDANFPCLTAPGVVTLVIAPYYPVAEPVPSEGLLECVWRYLDRRRPVATTLHITGPAYTEITVTAAVAIRTGAGGANVQARILSALQSFLDPLTGGPDALGWPFGRSVDRSEILRLIQDVPGVDHVDTLSMQSDSGASQCGDIPLCPTALTRVRAAQHRGDMNPRPPAELQIPFSLASPIAKASSSLPAISMTIFDTAQRLRRMHTLFLHNTWGIALGFSVYLTGFRRNPFMSAPDTQSIPLPGNSSSRKTCCCPFR